MTINSETRYYEVDEVAAILKMSGRNVRYHAKKWSIGKQVAGEGRRSTWLFTKEDIDNIAKHKKEIVKK